jgi:hypothetical protein
MDAKHCNQRFWTHLRVLIGVALVLLAMGACTPGQEAAADQKPLLNFETQITVHEGYEVEIALGVKNEGRKPFEGDKQFNGQMQLTNLETDKVRATANIVSLGRIEAGDTEWIMDWKGELDPGHYRLTWSADGYDKDAYAELSIGPDNVGTSPEDSDAHDEHPDLDPLLAQARADLARRLDVSESAITLHDVREAEFPDTSLGVPEPDKTYAEVITPGYVIELAVDGEIYYYHGAAARVVFVRTGEMETGPATDPEPAGSVPEPVIREDWQRFIDETYGFAFAYPANWTTKAMPTEGPGMPDDWPIVQVTMVFPASWAERFERIGPPAPSDPPAYAPLSVEVIEGPESQLRRVYPMPTRSEQVEKDGYTLITEVDEVSEEIQVIRYVAHSPEHPEVWVVFIDYLSGFPDRFTGNEEVAATALPIVESITFLQ